MQEPTETALPVAPATNPNIAAREERMEILSLIARGAVVWEKPATGSTPAVELKPDFGERRQAIAELNKMDGAYREAEDDKPDYIYRTLIMNAV